MLWWPIILALFLLVLKLAKHVKQVQEETRREKALQAWKKEMAAQFEENGLMSHDVCWLDDGVVMHIYGSHKMLFTIRVVWLNQDLQRQNIVKSAPYATYGQAHENMLYLAQNVFLSAGVEGVVKAIHERSKNMEKHSTDDITEGMGWSELILNTQRVTKPEQEEMPAKPLVEEAGQQHPEGENVLDFQQKYANG